LYFYCITTLYEGLDQNDFYLDDIGSNQTNCK